MRREMDAGMKRGHVLMRNFTAGAQKPREDRPRRGEHTSLP
jgi:hypothetical protein